MGTVCVRRGGGSTLFLPRPWDLAGVPFLPGWFGAAPAVGAGGCCPEPSAGGCSPQYPGIPLTLPGATRLQRHWSHLYGEAFPGVSISTGTIPRATSSMSRFPNQQTPLETEPGTGAEPAPPPPPQIAQKLSQHLTPGAKILLRVSQLGTHCLRAGEQRHRGSAKPAQSIAAGGGECP